MRQQRAGVATFLPLDTITPKPISDKFRNFAKGARLAMDVIEYSAEVERAMLFACGNALICDDLELAKHCVYDRGGETKGQPDPFSARVIAFSAWIDGLTARLYDFAAVTLDGSVVHKGGNMTGGLDGSSTGRKWDEQEVASKCTLG